MIKYKNIKIYIGDEYYNEYSIHQLNNKIEYADYACNNIIEFIDDNIKITRENKEFLLIMISNEETALYTLKELNYELDIKVNYFDKIEENNKLILCYQLETNDKAIKLILEGE